MTFTSAYIHRRSQRPNFTLAIQRFASYFFASLVHLKFTSDRSLACILFIKIDAVFVFSLSDFRESKQTTRLGDSSFTKLVLSPLFTQAKTLPAMFVSKYRTNFNLEKEGEYLCPTIKNIFMKRQLTGPVYFVKLRELAAGGNQAIRAVKRK